MSSDDATSSCHGISQMVFPSIIAEDYLQSFFERTKLTIVSCRSVLSAVFSSKKVIVKSDRSCYSFLYERFMKFENSHEDGAVRIIKKILSLI